MGSIQSGAVLGLPTYGQSIGPPPDFNQIGSRPYRGLVVESYLPKASAYRPPLSLYNVGSYTKGFASGVG